MNLLTEELPKAVKIDGAVYPIKWDFRTALRIMCAFEDKVLLPFEKHMIMLELLFDGNIPDNVNKASELAVRFLDCESGEDDGKKESAVQERLYSFSKDANYIFTAINQAHGIDLTKEHDLHWWKFCFLLQDISSDCFFSQLIYLRKQYNSGKLTKEERARYESMKDIAELDPIQIDDDPAVKEFMSLLGN